MWRMSWNCGLVLAPRQVLWDSCCTWWHNCGQETKLHLNRAVLHLVMGFIIQVCVPRGTKDICLVVMPHNSIMSLIIWLHTPWPEGICTKVKISIFFSSVMGCYSQCSSTQTWSGHADLVCALILVHLQGILQIHVICQAEHPTQSPPIMWLLRKLFVSL